MGLWSWEAKTDVVSLSPRAAEMFGHRSETNTTWTELAKLVHPEDLERARVAVARSMATGEDCEVEYRIQRAVGGEIWVAASGRVFTSGAEATGMAGALQDITERRRHEQERQALLQQEQQARAEAEALIEVARALNQGLDLESTVQTATDLATRLTGAKFGAFFYNVVGARQESYLLYALSGAPREAFAKFGLPRNTAVFAPTFKGEGVVRLDDVTKDPRYGHNEPHAGMPQGHLPVRSYLAVPVVARSGEAIGGMFFGHPQPGVFTERVERLVVGIAAHASLAIDNAKLYARVQSGAERLNFSLSSLQLGDWYWDAASDQVTFSQRTAEILGLPMEEKSTREAMRRVLHPDDQARARNAAAEAVQQRKDYDIEYRVLNAAGGVSWVAVRGRPIFGPQGEVSAMMGVIQDITERRSSEEALRESRAQLQEYANALEQRVADRTAQLRETIGELEAFSYSVSHDMRAPLRAMQGYAELLLHSLGARLDADAQHYLSRISKNAQRLELLVRDVLAYSKVSKADIGLSQVDLSVFLPPLLATITEAQREGVTLRLGSHWPVVRAHEAYLSQVFTNLVGNALKFVAADRPPQIEISAEQKGAEVTISVRDNGIGIDPSHFERIFEIFGRVYPDKSFEGTGIGLAIVKKAVQRMGGTVSVHSELGQGSTFSFTLAAG